MHIASATVSKTPYYSAFGVSCPDHDMKSALDHTSKV